MSRDERELTGTLHPEVVSQMRTAQRLSAFTEEQLMEELGRRDLDKYPPPPSLDELAKKYGTDKGPAEHNYTPLYAEKFWLHRYDQLTLLELGIWKGASLRMWRDYFPNATIIGLDRNKPLPELDEHDIIQSWGDQDDAALIDNLGSHHAPFHIIIDDASHISSKTIASFKLLWPHLAPGGIYVIEDLQTSYDAANYGGQEATPVPWGRTKHCEPTAMQFCKSLTDEVNHGLYSEEYWQGYDIASVEFHLNICFITKKGKWSAC